MEMDLFRRLSTAFNQGFIEKEIDFGGFKWKLRTLNERETVWRDKFVALSAATSFLSAKRVPTLAIAIKAIDGKPLAEILKIDGLRVEGQNMLPVTDEFNTIEFIAAEMFKKTLEQMPSAVIDELFIAFSALDEESRKVIEGVAKSPDFFRGSEKGSDSAGEAGSDVKDGSAAD